MSRIGELKTAEKHYKSRQEAIKYLMGVDGFSHIIDYWEFEANSTMDQLRDRKTPVEDVKYLQGRNSAAIEFLDYLDNMSR